MLWFNVEFPDEGEEVLIDAESPYADEIRMDDPPLDKYIGKKGIASGVGTIGIGCVIYVQLEAMDEVIPFHRSELKWDEDGK